VVNLFQREKPDPAPLFASAGSDLHDELISHQIFAGFRISNQTWLRVENGAKFSSIMTIFIALDLKT
jgi:hypothetical protein